MEVMQILTEMNAGQELIIAGALHDTVEDADVSLDEIGRRFGPRVAELVASRTEDTDKSWSERKHKTLELLKTADRDTKLLMMADKLSNLRSMYADYEEIGERLWERFSASRESQAGYNRQFAEVLYELQFDADAGPVYRETAALCRSLFGGLHGEF